MHFSPVFAWTSDSETASADRLRTVPGAVWLIISGCSFVLSLLIGALSVMDSPAAFENTTLLFSLPETNAIGAALGFVFSGLGYLFLVGYLMSRSTTALASGWLLPALRTAAAVFGLGGAIGAFLFSGGILWTASHPGMATAALDSTAETVQFWSESVFQGETQNFAGALLFLGLAGGTRLRLPLKIAAGILAAGFLTVLVSNFTIIPAASAIGAAVVFLLTPFVLIAAGISLSKAPKLAPVRP